ncbi:MAG: EamA family transporter [Nitrospinae bacterium]|nr:EamA family transporter [Nitrospinota bacterium]
MWFFYSLSAALFISLTDVVSKKALSKESTPLIAWVRCTYSIPFLLLTVPFVEFPALDKTFFYICAILLPLEITSFLLYLEALKISPLSLTLPFLSFTPVFLIITSYLTLGESVDTSGFIGILMVTAGAYLMNVHTLKHGLLEPVRAITRERGSLLMLIAALIFSITSNLGKIAIQHSNTLFFSVFYPALLSLSLFPIMIFKSGKESFNKSLLTRKGFYIIGIFQALEILFHFTAVALIEVPYMISVKRTSLLFGIIFGAVFFGETHIRERLAGGIIMIIGVILISVF